MSRLYDTVEPAVITEEMLNAAVKEQGPKGDAGRIADEEGISFNKVEKLRLSYKNILEIDNLTWFDDLTHLQLDNNIIEKITGISHLVKLKWLDLSFNNIEVIDGLQTLVNLEDLTLFNNRISRMENLDTLKNLQVLSIGNNLLKDLENIKYLRMFKNLRAINLNGNPFCDKQEFRIIVLAFLPQLTYLNYKLIDNDERVASYEKEQLRVESLLSDEKEREAVFEEEQEIVEKEKGYSLAFVEGLDKDQLFDSLFTDDPDGQSLKELSKNAEHAEEIKKKFAEACYVLFEYGLEEYTKREEEIAAFWDCLNDAKSLNKNNGIQLISDFIQYKNTFYGNMSNEADSDKSTNEFKAKIRELQSSLMGLELHLVDQIEEVVNEFERNLSEMVAKFRENVEAQMGKCRELDVIYQTKVSEEALAVQEKINKGDPTDDISEELRMILIDKDSLTNSLSASKDAHMLKIETKTDDINNRVQKWFQGLIEDIRKNEEVQRNRSRVLEINMLIDNFFLELENFEQQAN